MKTAIITGASGDIGKAISKKFLSNGWNVVACYFSNEASVLELREYAVKSEITFVKADISQCRDDERIFEIAQKTFGRIDLVVNNAGVSTHGLVQDVTEEEMDKVIGINIKGTFNMCALGAKYMVNNHSGAIVNISSMWGDTGASCEALYSMTKSAISGLTKALAKELGPSGIRVNCVSPGLIDTKMNSCYSKEDLDAICEETPLMCMGTAEDVANAVYYLSHEDSSFITGQIIGVNGGYVI